MTGFATVVGVAVGGGCGALLRGFIEHAAAPAGVPSWAAILGVNLLGCVLIGYLIVWLEVRLHRAGESRLARHPRGQRLAHVPGLLAPDPTLPPTEIARARSRLRVESGLLFTGLLGGLTTFSAFGLDLVSLMQGGLFVTAGVNLGLSVLGGAAGVVLGLEVGLLAHGRRQP
ncbi:MAG: CrcB family protein [Phycisphaerales bacterium]|nr:CrcB family protein [Phycisphaerales bacterium]